MVKTVGGAKSVLLGVFVSVSTVVVIDVAIGQAFLRDGRFGSIFVPPFDLVFNDKQAASLARNNEEYGQFDAELGWSIRSGGRSQDGKARATAGGFRGDREANETPAPGMLRMAVFGDSFSHGDEVDNADTWPHLLQEVLPGTEVLNFAVNGYGPDQALLRYRRDGARYRPHVAIMGYMTENLLRSVSVYRPAYVHHSGASATKPRFRLGADGALKLVPSPVRDRAELAARVRDGSLLPVLLEDDYWVRRFPLAYEGSPLLWSSLTRIVYGYFENSGRDPAPYYADTNSEPFRTTHTILRQFAMETRAAGAQRSVVVVFPNRTALAKPLAGEEPYWRTLTQALADDGIEVIDLSADLAKFARARGTDHLFGAAHYSPEGNREVARLLAVKLTPAL